MASQPPQLPPAPLPAPGPGSPLHLLAAPPKSPRHPKNPEAPSAPPLPRRPIVDIAVARRVVEAGVVLIAREMDGKGGLDEKWKIFRSELKALHLDAADAEFEDRFPRRLQGRDLIGSRAGQPEEPLP